MKKIVTISMMTLLFASINANAQIGITRDGQLKRCTFGLNYKDEIASILLYPVLADEAIPEYLPNTKSVTIRAYEISYNHFEETCDTSNISNKKIVLEYDRAGKITKSSYYTRERYLTGTRFKEKDSWTFAYDEAGRLSSINSGEVRLIYDEKGYLAKIKYIFTTPNGVGNYPTEYHLNWGNQTDIPINAKVYMDGSYFADWKMSKSQNNLVYSVELTNVRSWMRERSVTVNKGINKEHVSSDWISGDYIDHLQEIKYDANGNLVLQLFYEMKDIGKYYTGGWKYEYEYAFYDNGSGKNDIDEYVCDCHITYSPGYTTVDKEPEFPGGEKALKEWFKQNVRSDFGLSFISSCNRRVVVKCDGTIARMYHANDENECEKEFTRLLNLMPKWTPATKNGENVCWEFNLPKSIFEEDAPPTSTFESEDEYGEPINPNQIKADTMPQQTTQTKSSSNSTMGQFTWWPLGIGAAAYLAICVIAYLNK